MKHQDLVETKSWGKLVKVVLEYENEIHTLKDKDARKWMDACDSCTGLVSFHGMNPFNTLDVNWKIERKRCGK